MVWKVKNSCFSIGNGNSLSSQAYNGVKNVSMSVVSLIVKFSHKVQFANKMPPVPPQRDCSFDAVPEQQMFLIVIF